MFVLVVLTDLLDKVSMFLFTRMTVEMKQSA